MKRLDMRFETEMCREMIEKKFNKYRCDGFQFTNSVTQIVGIYIGGKVYALTNIQESVDYFGYRDDVGLFRLAESQEDLIHSAFVDVQQKDTPVEEKIKGIKLVNECQKTFQNGIQQYEVWLTRAIVFESEGGNQIAFEKDRVPFSEEIIIRKGYDLVNEILPNTDFREGWEDNITPECEREIVEIK